MNGCTHRRATFHGIQHWPHRPDVILFNCPDCRGTFALETLLALWHEEEAAGVREVRMERSLTPAT